MGAEMSSDASATESSTTRNLTEFKRTRVKSVHSLVIVRRPKQFSGPEINPADIIVSEKISDDEKSSYGAVLKGFCYGCPVAIKVIRASGGDNSQLLEGFKEEVKLMSEITHPNVCLFLGACFDDEVMLVTELLEGDLMKLLESERGKNYTLFQKVRAARDVAQGMAWLHHIGIVHLDLKPSNILYDSGERLKVADFGLARFKSEDGYIPGACGGTPLYSAPEVLMKEDFTDKADVYSFALILSYILTGKEPYSNFVAWDEFFEAVVRKGHRPPLPDTVPRKLRRLIQTCWAFTPDDRPSFIDILAILELVLLDAAVEDPIGRRIWKTFFFDTKQYEHMTINRLITNVSWSDFLRMLEALLYIPDGPLEQPVDLIDKPLGINPTDDALYLAPDERLHEYARLGGEKARRRVDDEIDRRNRVIELQCLKTLLAPEGVVKVERYGFICKLFGPIMDEEDVSGEGMLARIANTMNETWFHGDMSSQQAYTVLKDKKPGSFLVRFSVSQQSFCVSSVVSKSSKQRLQRSSSAVAPAAVSSSGGDAAPDSAAGAAESGAGESGGNAAAADGDAMARSRSAASVAGGSLDLDAVVHVPIERCEGGFRFPRSKKTFRTLNELIEDNGKLTRPCAVGKKRFGYIFASLRASHFGYLNADDRNPFVSSKAGSESNDAPAPAPAPATSKPLGVAVEAKSSSSKAGKKKKERKKKSAAVE